MRRVLRTDVASLIGVVVSFCACASVPAMPAYPIAAPHTRPFLRVATLNLYNPPKKRRARFQTQLETLRHIDADIIALQEVATGIHLGGEPASFLASQLGFAGIRFWHQENLGIFRTGLGLLARYPISNARYHAFDRSIPFDPKGYTSATVTTPRGPLIVVCVHLASTDDREIMASQMAQLSRGVKALAAEGPVLVLGDFNLQPDDPLFKELGAESLWDHVPKEALHPTWNASLDDDCSREGGELIDHVLIVESRRDLGRLRFVGGRIVVPTMRPHPSDHCPVVAELELDGR